MIRSPLRRFAIVTLAFAGLIATLVPKPAAAAGTTVISCRASALRLTGLGALSFIGTVEPVVSNSSQSVCANDADGIGPFVLPNGLGIVGALNTQTTFTKTALLHRGTAAAVVTTVVLFIPGAPIITVEFLASQVEVTCHVDGTRPAGNRIVGTSTVVGLAIGGNAIVVPPGPLDIPLPLLGILHLNEKTRTPPGTTPHVLTQRALHLDLTVAAGGLADLLDLVIAESVGDYHLP